MAYKQKQCIIINKESSIQEGVRFLHFDEKGNLADFLENQITVEVGDFDIKKFDLGIWKYNGTNFDELESGYFYLKTDGTFANFVEKNKISKYTNISPLPKFEDGTTQSFNETFNIWGYDFKGSELIEAEKQQALILSKNQKFAELEIAFEKTKTIVIQNGTTLKIENRNVFLSRLEEVKIIDSNSDIIKSYQQIDEINGKIYNLACVPVILKKVYEKYFTIMHSDNFKEALSEYNKMLELQYKARINISKTIEELNDIVFNFESPQGITIVIDDVVKDILADDNIADYVKNLTQTLQDENGNIHLVCVKDI